MHDQALYEYALMQLELLGAEAELQPPAGVTAERYQRAIDLALRHIADVALQSALIAGAAAMVGHRRSSVSTDIVN